MYISGTSMTQQGSVPGYLWLCNKPARLETSEALSRHALGDSWKDQGLEPSFYGGQRMADGLGLPSVLLWFLGLTSLCMGIWQDLPQEGS